MSEPQDAHLDPKARAILAAAAQVFSEKGYHSATMRDIAAVAGTSLAGMYYYFDSKEEMLYSIQKFCFTAVLAGLAERLQREHDPWRRLYAFIENHLQFFTENVRAMRVLSHESESLNGSHLAQIQSMKREYFRQLGEILRPLLPQPIDERRLREQVLSVFGMVNWIYTWYDPTRDGNAGELAECMYTLLEHGIAPRQ